MDLSWCPACDRQFFVTNSLYCSEECRHKDALSTSPCSTLPHYGFSRCSSPKFAHSPLASPSWSLLRNPPASITCDSLKIDSHFRKDEPSTLPEGVLLLGRRNAIECNPHGEAAPHVSFTLINASAVTTATETTFTTITVETREIQVGLAGLPIRKKQSFIKSAWSMFFA
ncbi:7867_t:CDS:1 [Paraglomus occultum]|uniref:7867_t:CDS:1 n=1 Tax=Paraglomus occultum TaxID=144539 RepID=A0A9N8ZGS4_9GLOM|nr:7867_t:CDS:1 [Paraglomus occultum]